MTDEKYVVLVTGGDALYAYGPYTLDEATEARESYDRLEPAIILLLRNGNSLLETKRGE
jgi:hypothetical protein